MTRTARQVEPREVESEASCGGPVQGVETIRRCQKTSRYLETRTLTSIQACRSLSVSVQQRENTHYWVSTPPFVSQSQQVTTSHLQGQTRLSLARRLGLTAKRVDALDYTPLLKPVQGGYIDFGTCANALRYTRTNVSCLYHRAEAKRVTQIKSSRGLCQDPDMQSNRQTP